MVNLEESESRIPELMKITFSLIVTNISNTAFTLLLCVKVPFLPKNANFFCKKNAGISKIKMVLVLKGTFPENAYVCTYVPNFKFLA